MRADGVHVTNRELSQDSGLVDVDESVFELDKSTEDRTEQQRRQHSNIASNEQPHHHHTQRNTTQLFITLLIAHLTSHFNLATAHHPDPSLVRASLHSPLSC
jgi:hypothetical protein